MSQLYRLQPTQPILLPFMFGRSILIHHACDKIFIVKIFLFFSLLVSVVSSVLLLCDTSACVCAVQVHKQVGQSVMFVSEAIVLGVCISYGYYVLSSSLETNVVESRVVSSKILVSKKERILRNIIF